MMITTIFQEKSNTYRISEPIIGRFSPNLVLVRSLHSAPHKKRCNTLQGFGAFFGQSCDRDRFLFSFIAEFLSLSFFSFFILEQLVISFLIIKTIILLGLAGYQIIIPFWRYAPCCRVTCHIQCALVVRKFACAHARL